MGVCEDRAMHWQQGDQFGAPGGGGLSPTLPPSARCDRSEGAGSAPPPAPSSAGSAPSSGCSTPSNNNHGARAACCAREQGEMCCGPAINPDLLPRPHSSFEHHIPKLEPEGPESPYSPPPLDSAPPATLEGGVAVCAGCGLKITDRYYLQAVDRRWHAACLQCCQCRNSLDGDITCFSRDGNIYCKKDYYRLFGVRRCGRCQAPILSSELVMRARELVFHVRCFTCEACGSPLAKGDHFGLRAGAVLCRLHFELPPAPGGPDLSPGMFPVHHPPPASALAGPFGPPFVGPGGEYIPPPLRPPGPGEPRFGFEGPGGHAPPPSAAPPPPPPRQKGRPRKRKPKDLEGMTAGLDLNQDYLDSIPFGRSPGPPGMHGSQRTKRMRTSFKHHQLRTMKSYFAINHNPDAKDLKQLSQKTGLPKRVLQVWFQNARAKWRRMMLKQEGKSGEKCSPPDSMSEMDLYPTSSMNSMQSMAQHSPTFFSQGSPSSLDCA